MATTSPHNGLSPSSYSPCTAHNKKSSVNNPRTFHLHSLEDATEELAGNPTAGTPLGHDVYKVRLAIASKGKGKSGGARVITCVKVIDEKIYMVTIFDKGRLANLTKSQILELLKKTGLL